MSLRVVKPGALTTVQDLGRPGFRHLGVGAGGALDTFSARAANLLVGNQDAAALLEITLSGPTLHFELAARIALCGAHIDARVGEIAIPGWRHVDLPAGSELRLGACRDGARAYLAVAGGLALAAVMGSRATDVRGGFGGVDGRALRAGDRLAFAARDDVARSEAVAIDAGDAPASTRAGDALASARALGDRGFERAGCDRAIVTRQAGAPAIARAWLDPRPDLDLALPAIAHAMPGADALARPGALFAAAWRVAPASDRQGLRLEGPAATPAGGDERAHALALADAHALALADAHALALADAHALALADAHALALADARERVSAPVAPGAVQLPPDGRPIVLLGEAQTVGGYPVIAHVATADLPRLAQCRPGDTVRFAPIDRDGALARLRAQEARLARMRLAVAQASATIRACPTP